MKTKVEVLGYEIEIEEVDGVVTVKADLDGETVEEFTLEAQGQSEGQDDSEDNDDDVKGFGDFDSKEEKDFGDEESEEESDDDFEESEEEEGKALESFQSFINKRK